MPWSFDLVGLFDIIGLFELVGSFDFFFLIFLLKKIRLYNIECWKKKTYKKQIQY